MASARPVLRGRSDELGTALSALRRSARSGAAAMIVVSGEPGIGKTALVRAILEQADRGGSAVGYGRTDEVDQVVSGAPLLLALRSGPRPLLDGTAFAGLQAVYDQQLWLVEQIGQALEEAAARRPVVLAVDDVHWADPLTRFALRVLPSRLAASPVAWILSSRPANTEVIDDVVAAAGDAVPAVRLPLGPLTPEAMSDLARDRTGAAPSDEVRTLLGRVGGNPFWAVQVLDGLDWRRQRGLRPDDMHAELIRHVRRRLEPLDPEIVALVRLTAVWGRPLPVDVAADLLGGLPTAKVIFAARVAADNGLLATTESGVDFPHGLVRDAVYADIPAAGRDTWHRESGRRLMQTGGSQAAAAHFLAVAAPGDREATDVLLQAAEDSAATMPEQASDLARKAFGGTAPEQADRLGTGLRVIALLLRLQRAAAALAVADELIAEVRDPAAVAALEAEAARALWQMGAYADAGRRAGRVPPGIGIPAVTRARLTAIVALAGGHGEAGEAVLAEGRRLGDDLTQRLALLSLAEASRAGGRHDETLRHLTRLREAQPDEHLTELVRGLHNLDRYDDAEAILAAVRQRAQGNTGRILPSYLYAQIWQDHNLGRLDAADAGARTLLQVARELDDFSLEVDARSVLCAVHMYRAEFTEARAALQPALDRASVDRRRMTLLALGNGWLTAEEGDLGRAMDLLGSLLDGPAAWHWVPAWMHALATVGRAAGNHAYAQRAADLAELGAVRNPGVRSLQGVALLTRGLVDDDPERLDRAVEVLRAGPRPMLLAWALADHAAAARRAGDTPTADRRVGEAVTAFDAMGATPDNLADPYLRTAFESGHRPARRRSRTGPDALTDAERRVAELVSAGHTSRSAAAELGISPNTLNTHLKSVFSKLGVRSRVQLTNLLRRASDPPEPPS